MADRIDIGIDTEEESTPNFFQSQRTISSSEYGSSFVNFYNTALGLPSLEKTTGIDVSAAPEIALTQEPTVQEERGDEDIPNILQATSFQTGQPMAQVTFANDGTPLGGSTFNSYSDFLKSEAKMADRIPFVEGVVEGLLDESKSVDLGLATKSEVKSGVKKVEALPSRLDRVLEGKMTADDSASLMKGMASAVAGVAGAVATSLIGGRTVQSAFGDASYRPPGALGFVSDLVHSMQYGHMEQIRGAIAAGAADTGFAVQLGSMGITRAPGSGSYTGNTQGLSHTQIKSLEAISKGYDPGSNGGRYNMFDPSKNIDVEQAGGMFISQDKMDGFYRANGSFYSPRSFTSSAYANESHAIAAAAKAGISRQEFDSALAQARSGERSLQDAIRSVQTRNASAQRDAEQAATAAAQRSAGEAGVRIEQEGEVPTSEQQYSREPSAERGTQSLGVGTFSASSQYDRGFVGGFNQGGRVGLAMGGAPRVAAQASGFIDRPPEQVSEAESVADNQLDAVPEGTFIINSPAVEFAGSDDIRKMLMDAHKEAIRRGITVDNDEKGAKLIDVALSRGEVKVAPHLAKIIGYDRLNKINNRGKPEVEERIKENGQAAPAGTMQAAMGMLISGQMKKPDLTQQDVQGFIPQPQEMPETPIPSRDEDVFFDYKLGDIKGAIKNVEIKGFEKNPYIFTGIKRKGAASSAFGPMQITASTLKDLKQRSGEYDMLSEKAKDYVDALIQQGDDKVNVELYGGIYRNDSKQAVKSETKKKLGRYGTGTISKEMHEEFYDVIGDIVLRQKLMDHDTLSQALASYGEGSGYAQKVMKGLQ